MTLFMADSSEITSLTVRINISDIFEFFHIDFSSLQEQPKQLDNWSAIFKTEMCGY